MRQNYSQRLEMQIPNQRYSGITITNDLEKFLNDHYTSDNFDEINEFIVEDLELENMIRELPEIVTKRFNYTQISLNFMKETDPIEKILEIVIYTNMDEKALLEKEDLLIDEIIDKYPKIEKEYIFLVES